MYVYMYIYLYIYIYVCVCTYIYIYICTSISRHDFFFRTKLPSVAVHVPPRHDCGPSTAVKKQPTQQGEDWFLGPQASKPWQQPLKDRKIPKT